MSGLAEALRAILALVESVERDPHSGAVVGVNADLAAAEAAARAALAEHDAGVVAVVSGAVDVLSRLSNWATCEALLGGNFDKAYAIDDVRAAVAELIETAVLLEESLPDDNLLAARLRAALVRVQGGAA